MVNNTLQIAGTFISLLGLFLMVITVAHREWRKNDPQREVLETVIRTTGLWEKCTFFATGNYQCDDYDAFFIGLPVLLQGARCFSMFGIVFQLIAVLLALLGLDCVAVGGDSPAKPKMMVVAGFLAVTGGVFIGIGVSWFAAEVLSNYYHPAGNFQGGQYTSAQQGNYNQYMDNNERYIYGRALFIGWSSMLVDIIGGVMMVCSSWSSMSGEDDDDTRGNFNKPLPNYGQNYGNNYAQEGNYAQGKRGTEYI